MNRPDDELDNLLRSHLSSELDAERGAARRAFEQQVTRPMQRQLRRRSWQAHVAQFRHWGAIGLAMAACMTVGAFLPSILGLQTRATPAPTEVAQSQAIGSGPVVTPQFADLERTTVFHHTDAGAVLLDGGVPGRKVLQQRYDTLRYTDPSTHERLEYVIPSQQDLFYPVNRQ